MPISDYTPPAAGSLGAWLRADADLFTTTARDVAVVAPGDPVGSWTNQAGAAHGNQATAASRPAWQAGGIGGRPFVRHNGSSQWLRAALGAPASQSHTVVIVARPAPGATITGGYRGYCCWGSGTGSNDNSTIGIADNGNLWFGGFNQVSGFVASVAAGFEWRFIFKVYDASNALLRAYSGADLILTRTSTTFGGINGNFDTGHHYGATAARLNCDVAEAFCWTSALSDSDRLDVLAYLSARYAGTAAAARAHYYRRRRED